VTCVVCARRPTEQGQVCDADRQWLDRTLAELIDLYALLPARMVPGQTQGQRVTGSKEAPMPLRVDPLDLGMPARPGTIHDPLGDQVGYVSVATVLDLWVTDWRTKIDCGDLRPGPTVVELIRWLRIWLPAACDQHPAIGDFAAEMKDTRTQLRAVAGVTEVRPEYLDIPCRRCDLKGLYRLPGEDRVECGSCGSLLTEDEYLTWVRLLAAHMREVPA
jgi:ribosomal protein S27E